MGKRTHDNEFLIYVLREAIKEEHEREPYNRSVWEDLNSFLDSCAVVFD